MQEVIISIQKKYVSAFKGEFSGDIRVEVTTNPVQINVEMLMPATTSAMSIKECEDLSRFWKEVGNTASLLTQGKNPRLSKKTSGELSLANAENV